MFGTSGSAHMWQHQHVRSAYFLQVRRIINEVDPDGLIPGHVAPEDEYDSEIEKLLKWREPVTADRVLRAFGDIPLEQAESIAARVAALGPADP